MLIRDNHSRETRRQGQGTPPGGGTGLAAGRRRSAFSLVELLVVIGIIAGLISILLPAISVVRGWADNTKCLSNLKQIGAAIIAYSNDHSGYLVPGDYYGQDDLNNDPGIGINQNSAGNWADILVDEQYITSVIYPYVPGQPTASDLYDRTSILSCPQGQNVDAADQGVGLPLSVTDGRGACFTLRPSDIDHAAVQEWYAVNCIRRAQDSSLSAQDLLPRPFSFLPDFSTKTASWQLNKLSQFQNDTHLPLVFDGVWCFWPSAAGVTPINARHGGNIYTNILFADFHCESQPAASLPNNDWYVQ